MSVRLYVRKYVILLDLEKESCQRPRIRHLSEIDFKGSYYFGNLKFQKRVLSTYGSYCLDSCLFLSITIFGILYLTNDEILIQLSKLLYRQKMSSAEMPSSSQICIPKPFSII